MDVEVRPYSRAYDRDSFDCGNPELNAWLRTQATQQQRTGNTRTFLCVEHGSDRVVGFYATTTYRLGLDEASQAFGVGKRRYPVPAVLLARLAVDVGAQGNGIGSRLLVHALREIAKASASVGFEVVVVHAIDPDAVTFYAKAGFARFEGHPLHLFLPTKDLLRTFSELD